MSIQLSPYSQGKKIAIMVSGTRGDVQPLIALGGFLQASGFQIMISTNVNHARFVEKFGLKVAGCNFDFEEFLRGPNEFSEAVISGGSIMKAVDCMGKKLKEEFPAGASKEWEAIKEFQPDLILLHYGFALCQGLTFAQALKIPSVVVGLFPFVPSSKIVTALSEPCCHYAAWLFFLRLFFNMEKDNKMPKLKEMLAKDIAADEFWNDGGYATTMGEWMQPITPNLIGLSEAVCPWPRDIPPAYKERSHLTGFWVINQKEQERRLKRQDSHFGGGEMGPLSDFLDAGEPPVYMGWGSMIALGPEHMAQLAVRALMKAKLRCVIAGGWAKLEAKHLDGQPDSAELQQYAAKNVLWLASAPHEWLFPRCAVTVHHGGAGTMAVALRAGIPTIVTPIGADQFDNAQVVARSGCGIAMTKLHAVTPNALSRALLRCKSDQTMIRAAATMGEKLRSEDGLTVAAKIVDRFLTEEVSTGRWAAAQARRIQRRKEAVARPPSCFCFALRALCCGKLS